MNKIALIESQRHFKEMAVDHLVALASCAEPVNWEAQTNVFEMGQNARYFYLLVSGSVELLMPSTLRGELSIQKVHAGELLGWSWLFPPYKWHFDARTLEPTQALAFDVETFRLLCEQDPALSAAIYQRISRMVVERLQATRLQLIEMSEKTESLES